MASRYYERSSPPREDDRRSGRPRSPSRGTAVLSHHHQDSRSSYNRSSDQYRTGGRSDALSPAQDRSRHPYSSSAGSTSRYTDPSRRYESNSKPDRLVDRFTDAPESLRKADQDEGGQHADASGSRSQPGARSGKKKNDDRQRSRSPRYSARAETSKGSYTGRSNTADPTRGTRYAGAGSSSSSNNPPAQRRNSSPPHSTAAQLQPPQNLARASYSRSTALKSGDRIMDQDKSSSTSTGTGKASYTRRPDFHSTSNHRSDLSPPLNSSRSTDNYTHKDSIRETSSKRRSPSPRGRRVSSRSPPLPPESSKHRSSSSSVAAAKASRSRRYSSRSRSPRRAGSRSPLRKTSSSSRRNHRRREGGDSESPSPEIVSHKSSRHNTTTNATVVGGRSRSRSRSRSPRPVTSTKKSSSITITTNRPRSVSRTPRSPSVLSSTSSSSSVKMEVFKRHGEYTQPWPSTRDPARERQYERNVTSHPRSRQEQHRELGQEEEERRKRKLDYERTAATERWDKKARTADGYERREDENRNTSARRPSEGTEPNLRVRGVYERPSATTKAKDSSVAQSTSTGNGSNVIPTGPKALRDRIAPIHSSSSSGMNPPQAPKARFKPIGLNGSSVVSKPGNEQIKKFFPGDEDDENGDETVIRPNVSNNKRGAFIPGDGPHSSATQERIRHEKRAQDGGDSSARERGVYERPTIPGEGRYGETTSDSRSQPDGGIEPETFASESRYDGRGEYPPQLKEQPPPPPPPTRQQQQQQQQQQQWQQQPVGSAELYERIVQVGEGTYGKVYKAKNIETGTLVALKRIRMEAEKDGFPVTAIREIKLLQNLRHPNVVNLIEMLVSRGHVYMVFEYLDHDLTGVLHHPSITFSQAHLKSLMQQFLEGLGFIHRQGVLHRDLKGSNILLSKNGELKIADFGLARFYLRGKGNDYTNRVITQWYKPPELLFGATVYGEEVDMWSAGCIFLELFARRPVFQGQDEIHQLEVIFRALGTPTLETWEGVQDLPWYELVKPKTQMPNRLHESFDKWISPAGLLLAEGLLAFDPQCRPTAAKALEMDYFTKEDPPAELPTVLSMVKGEWHEYESKKARKKQRDSSVLGAGSGGLNNNNNNNTNIKMGDGDDEDDDVGGGGGGGLDADEGVGMSSHS